MDFECTKYNIEESVDICTNINEKETEDTNDCVHSQDESNAAVQLDSDVVSTNESTINLRLRDIKLQVDHKSGDAPSAKKSRGTRKRDHPSVLAGDDLIRNWCQMQCTKCTESFASFTFKDVKNHYHKEHDINGFLVCCRKKFFRRIRALEHIARHINPREFSCEKCNKIFSDKPALLNHLDSHVSLDKRAYKCDMCEDSFMRKYQLSQHHKARHLPEEKRFVCDECSKAFKSKSILHAHTRNVHNNKNVLMCDVCAKTFKSKQCLQQHFSKHKSESGEETTKLQCTICSAWLKHPNSLRGHMARHLEAQTEHKCEECGKNYPTSGALRSHRTYVHNNTKLFPCTVCPKTFKRSVTLKEHIAGAHTGEVLYQCPFCTKTFNSSANFYAHKKRKHRKNGEFAA
ncbi:hypothetical protein HA402_006310 [Bradysia odoriphaga]|nr:hypothetical protein HA402_006310 [Bradysia odoriphaga]